MKREREEAEDVEVEDTVEEVEETGNNEEVADSKETDEATKSDQKGKRKRKRKKKNAETPVVEEEDANDDDSSNAVPNTIYVEGIAYAAVEKDVEDFFMPCGRVIEVRMPRYQDSGRPRGYAHVDFSTSAAVPNALRLNGKDFMGRYLTVKRANEPKINKTIAAAQAAAAEGAGKTSKKGCTTVFVKNLPYDVTEDQLRDSFSDCGMIVSVRLAMWNHTKQQKGFGYVEFQHSSSAVTAVRKTGMRVGNRMVLVDFDAGGGPKSSFRVSSGQYYNKVDVNLGGGLGKKKVGGDKKGGRGNQGRFGGAGQHRGNREYGGGEEGSLRGSRKSRNGGDDE